MSREATIYEQWVAQGMPYWSGVALFNQVRGYTALKKCLCRAESAYNKAKLRHMLQLLYHHPPARKAPPRSKAKPRPVLPVPPPPQPEPPPQWEVEAADWTPPRPMGPSKYKALPFHKLPPVLQQARMLTLRRYNERATRHARLRDEGPALAPEDRQMLCREIIEITHAMDRAWEAEAAYATTGAVPVLAEDDAARIAKMDPFAANRELKNQVAPRTSRLRKKLATTKDPEQRLQLEMQLRDAEHVKSMLEERIRAYDRQRKV